MMRAEILGSLIPLGLFAIGFGMAFTQAQRRAIIERDKGVCQAPFAHKCDGSEAIPLEDRSLQVHHILPQRYCEVVGIPNPDFAENGITLCKHSHIGPQGIHPDIAHAHTKDDFKKVFEERNKKLENHEVYWDASHDRQMHAIAVKRTQLALKGSWVFPEKGKATPKKVKEKLENT